VPEVRLFRKFAKEKFTVDELSFFLDVRMGLIGKTKSEEPSVFIPYNQCRVVMEKILGSFSPILQVISGEAEKCVKQGSIDYAEFCLVMLKFYENERRKRRNAVRLMFQSRRFSGGHDWFDFENFIAMIQALGFRGSLDDIFGLFREASLLGGGDVSLDALLMSMDNLSFHFYTIDVPGQWKKPNEVTNVPRSVINRHLGTFMSWFEGFDGVQEKFDTWLLGKITAQVTTLDKLQQGGAPVALVYQEYRTLLDWFQYMLNVMSKGMEEPMPAEKAERQLQLLESLIDLLVTAVVGDQNGQVQFTEFE
jgi:hypothetical protein